jgi:hypothetical protein
LPSERLDRHADLSPEASDKTEFAGLVRSGLERLRDAERVANSIDGRFDLAYNAGHALSLAALRYHGYRSSKRYVVFQVLPDTLGVSADVWRILDKAHKMRNRSEYEGVIDVDETLLRDLIAACQKIAEAVGLLPPL